MMITKKQSERKPESKASRIDSGGEQVQTRTKYKHPRRTFVQLNNHHVKDCNVEPVFGFKKEKGLRV